MNYTILQLPVSKDTRIFIENTVNNAGNLFALFDDHLHLANLFYYNSGKNFFVLLDRNYVSELVSIFSIITKKENYILSEKQKVIAAHQAFFQIAQIVCEPNMAYYEYADRHSNEEVIEELTAFRQADNLPTNIWIDVALGRKTLVHPHDILSIKNSKLHERDMSNDLRIFHANFIVMKKAISLKKRGLSGHLIILELLEWFHYEYIFIGSTFFFLNFYLCPHKPGLSRMVKSFDLYGLRNASWDLTFLQEYRLKIEKEMNMKDAERWLVYSDDKAIKKIIPLLSSYPSESHSEFYNRIRETLIQSWGKKTGIGKKIYEKMMQYKGYEKSLNRKANQINFDLHIQEIEKKLDQELGLT